MEQRHKILVVDDDELYVEAIEMLLVSDGHDVITASNADEALALLRTDKPDLVILDVMMDTVWDGVAVSRTMWEDDELRRIPVIIVSAIASTEYISHFPQDEYLNAVDFLFKPIDPPKLLESVHRFLK